MTFESQLLKAQKITLQVLGQPAVTIILDMQHQHYDSTFTAASLSENLAGIKLHGPGSTSRKQQTHINSCTHKRHLFHEKIYSKMSKKEEVRQIDYQ